jgi:sulfate permease, SulP family
LAALEKAVPAYGWLRDYRREDLAKDLTAAVIITAMLVPQGMAYALLAGLPPSQGLYASTVPAIVYALFGTSRHMPVGPPALMALLTFTSVSALAEPGSPEYISLALLLALMVGVFQAAIGFLRMGFVTNFISHPVLSGFIYASAVIIALSQVEHMLGIPLSGKLSAAETVREYAQRIGEVNVSALTLTLSTLAATMLLSRAAPRLPGPLLTVAAATVVVYMLGLDRIAGGVDVVGEVPGGLPTPSLPALDLGAIRALAPAALIVAFVGFVESVSVAKAIAARENYKIDSNQELKALGFANVAAAFFSGFPVAGSFSRTAVQYQSGGRTQLASIMTALMIVVVLLFLTPLFYYLPDAALAAVILVAVFGLVDLREARRIYRIKKEDGAALLVTFAVTLLFGVEQGILAGVAFALFFFVRRTAYPRISELGYVEGEDAFLGKDGYPKGRTFPKTLVLRFDARLYFANISFLEDYLLSATADRPDLKLLVVDFRGVNGIDVTAIEGLENLISEYRTRGVKVLFTDIKPQVRERLERAGWGEEYPEVIEHQTTRDAFRDVGLLEGREADDPGQRLR